MHLSRRSSVLKYLSQSDVKTCCLIAKNTWQRALSSVKCHHIPFSDHKTNQQCTSSTHRSQQGTLTLPDTWFRPPFWDLLMLQLLRPNSSNLPCLCSTFHLEYPLVLSRFYFMESVKGKQLCTGIILSKRAIFGYQCIVTLTCDLLNPKS